MYKGDYLKKEIQIEKEVEIFSNEWGTFCNDEVLFPSGFRGSYFRLTIGSGESVAVLPVTVDKKIVLIKNFRHGVRGCGVEVPKGGIEKNEKILDAAKRELLEETGYSTQNWIYVGKFAESPAVLSSFFHCFFAIDCVKSNQVYPEKTEAIAEVCEIAIDEYDEFSKKFDYLDLQTDWIIMKFLNNK